MLLTRNNIDLLSILRCPVCEGDQIKNDNTKLICSSCGASYDLKGGIPVVLDTEFSSDIVEGLEDKDAWEDYDNSKITKKVANYSGKQKSIYQRITPSCRVQIGPRYKEFLAKYGITGKVLEIGGGPNANYYSEIINCDINTYNTVDIIGDARKLPFKSQSFQAIICNSVLEHIYETEKVVNECHRVLEPGGLVFMCVPQVCGRHHTIDYHRWTLPGLTKQFSQFKIIEEGVILGPGMFVNHLFMSMFNSLTKFKFINSIACFVFEWLLFPLRFLDLLGKNNKDYQNYAHTIYIIGKK